MQRNVCFLPKWNTIGNDSRINSVAANTVSIYWEGIVSKYYQKKILSERMLGIEVSGKISTSYETPQSDTEWLQMSISWSC